jgi:hypothetical protein
VIVVELFSELVFFVANGYGLEELGSFLLAAGGVCRCDFDDRARWKLGICVRGRGDSLCADLCQRVLNRLLAGEDLSRWDIRYYILPDRSDPCSVCFEIGNCSSSNSKRCEVESAHYQLYLHDCDASVENPKLRILRAPYWLFRVVDNFDADGIELFARSRQAASSPEAFGDAGPSLYQVKRIVVSRTEVHQWYVPWTFASVASVVLSTSQLK